MALRFPESAEECVYFTRRTLENEGRIVCWVFREQCPNCHKSLMGKPRDDEGNIKIRAKEYVCPECKHAVDKQSYEDTLTASIQYICPKCKFEAETQIPFKRKKVKGADILRFQCGKCGIDIDIAKKFKEKKDS